MQALWSHTGHVSSSASASHRAARAAPLAHLQPLPTYTHTHTHPSARFTYSIPHVFYHTLSLSLLRVVVFKTHSDSRHHRRRAGVVPACASLDCLTVFTASVADGAEVMGLMRQGAAGPEDVWRRPPPPLSPASEPPAAGFRFAVPSPKQLDWAGPGKQRAPGAQGRLGLERWKEVHGFSGSC